MAISRRQAMFPAWLLLAATMASLGRTTETHNDNYKDGGNQRHLCHTCQHYRVQVGNPAFHLKYPIIQCITICSIWCVSSVWILKLPLHEHLTMYAITQETYK